uniref:Uncharacterized protein n=1 Tax=Arundo donax TaxID=35708 RepID=A0A0A9FBL2_ARUDO
MSLHFRSSLLHGSCSLGYQSVPCMLLQKYQPNIYSTIWTSIFSFTIIALLPRT